MEKRRKKREFLISTIAVIAIVAFGVYALTPGVAPNPGHLITQIAPPSGCQSGQYLEFSGGNWLCNTTSSGGITTPSPCSSGQYLQYTGTSWICSTVNTTGGGSGGTINDTFWTQTGPNTISYNGSITVEGDQIISGPLLLGKRAVLNFKTRALGSQNCIWSNNQCINSSYPPSPVGNVCPNGEISGDVTYGTFFANITTTYCPGISDQATCINTAEFRLYKACASLTIQ